MRFAIGGVVEPYDLVADRQLEEAESRCPALRENIVNVTRVER